MGRAGNRACIISIASSLVIEAQHVWPARVRVRFMLSLGLRARRTHTPPFGALHSHSSVRHLARWLPRRSGTLPPPRLRGVASRGARSFAAYSIALAFGVGVGFTAYENYQPFRHTVLAVVRCSRVAGESWRMFCVCRDDACAYVESQRRPYSERSTTNAHLLGRTHPMKSGSRPILSVTCGAQSASFERCWQTEVSAS